MNVVIRCDGAKLPEIGTGHVVRMLSIANELVENKICKKNEEKLILIYTFNKIII